jgi:hypothetical protein
MGLDITAYSKLSKIDAVFNADGEPIDPATREPIEGNYFHAYVNTDFGPERYEGVEDRAVYRYEDSFAFRAGSYGGYNEWREALAALAGYPTVMYERVKGYAPSAAERHDAAAWHGLCAGMPFVDLVNFSDCEGVIGPKVAAKLAKDFAEWDERAKKYDAGMWFYERYANWRKAFAMAADGGAVAFH